MFKRFGNTFLAAVLFLSAGTHWAGLQSVAWVGMIVTYSERAPLTVALKETFDGRHPCCVCKAIASAKKSEKKSEFAARTKILEFPPVTENFVLAVPVQFESLPRAKDTFAESRTRQPLTPPPRSSFV